MIGLFFVTSCNDDDDHTHDHNDDNHTDMPTLNIVELAQETAALSTLVDAVLSQNLQGTLSSDGPFTVFAPTNDAFVALLNSNDDWNALEDIDSALVYDVLTYHVIPAKVLSTELAEGAVSTLNGDITISLSDGAQIETTSGQTVNITSVDIEATNGVVHLIDAVLLP